MNNKIQSAIKIAITGTALSIASGSVLAAGAVFPSGWDGVGMNNHIMNAGDSISATSLAPSKNGYTDNPDLNNSAWAHAGNWYTFMTHETATTTISVSADVIGQTAPAFSVWASGNNEFDGGTGLGFETGLSGDNSPHSFNATGQLGIINDALHPHPGPNGTLWMTSSTIHSLGGGNMLETLGYANSGVHHTNALSTSDWGEDTQQGAFDVSITNTYENGITGSVSAGSAELVLTDLQAGWYTIFISGADNSLSGGGMDLHVSSVSAVPVPAAAYLFGTALFGLFATGRRKQKSA